MNHLRTILTGFCMGLADLVPWISWWTIAFISGLYEKLITSISNFDKKFFTYLFKGKWWKMRNHVNWTFLVALFGWAFLAIALWSWVLEWALWAYPVLIKVFFLGLVVASIIALLREYPLVKWSHVWLFIGGLVVWSLLVNFLNVTIPWWNIGLFIAWLVWSVAMILPWISGSYILLLIGAYDRVIENIDGLIDGIKAMDMTFASQYIIPVLLLMLWIVIGLLLMGRVLKRLLSKWHDSIIIFLIGLMTGALPAIIPPLYQFQTKIIWSVIRFLIWAGIVWGFFSWKWRKEGWK